MGANITAFLPAAGLSGRAVALDLRTGSSPQEELVSVSEAQSDREMDGLDAYKLAVLLFVAGVILSLCISPQAASSRSADQAGISKFFLR